MRVIAKVGEWLDARLQIAAPIREAVEHPVPKNTASWWYVFGSAALVVFTLQLVTGILLALVYVPSAAEAWGSLQALNHDVRLGWFIRALHGWGSNFMVAMMSLHMIQVFLFGAYKYPRELTWLAGVFLLLMTLGMAFTGQVLRLVGGRSSRQWRRSSRLLSGSVLCHQQGSQSCTSGRGTSAAQEAAARAGEQ